MSDPYQKPKTGIFHTVPPHQAFGKVRPSTNNQRIKTRNVVQSQKRKQMEDVFRDGHLGDIADKTSQIQLCLHGPPIQCTTNSLSFPLPYLSLYI